MSREKHIVRLRNAWLLTWEGTEGPALTTNEKIIAVLSGRKSESFIRDIVDVLYTRCYWRAYGQAMHANKRKDRESQFRHVHAYPGHIHYGKNPWIFGRRVEGLEIERDEHGQLEHLSWTEPAVYGNADKGAGVKEIQPAEKRSLTRALVPLSAELYPRRV